MSDPALQQVIEALWRKYEGLTRERLAELDRAILEAERGTLTHELRATAIAEAHKLAGSLGTFGLPSASKAASQIEIGFSDASLDSPKIVRIRERFESIRAAVEQRRQP